MVAVVVAVAVAVGVVVWGVVGGGVVVSVGFGFAVWVVVVVGVVVGVVVAVGVAVPVGVVVAVGGGLTSPRAKGHVMRKRKDVISVPPQWQEQFKAATFRTSFTLSLSQAMIEFLCAVADDVQWDRSIYYGNIHRPDNWMATSTCLERRGLIVRRCQNEIDKRTRHWRAEDFASRLTYEVSHYTLTPAGEAVVQLFRVTEIFVEAEAAVTKRYRKKA